MSIYLKELHILPVKYRIYFKISLLTFKCLHGLAPQYLQDIIFYNMHKDTTLYDRGIYNRASLLQSSPSLTLSNLKQCLRFFHIKSGVLCHYMLERVILPVF